MTKTVGEHWVCATLARHNWAPALTRDGIARTDILAVGTHLAHRPTVEIQVKTASDWGSSTSWPLGGVTRLIAASEHEWFVLVLLPRLPAAPRAFVVPRDHVSAGTWIVHQNWRTDPSAPEGKRNAGLSQARIQLVIWEGYEDRWDLLGTRRARYPCYYQTGSASVPRRSELVCLPGIHGTTNCHHGDRRSDPATRPMSADRIPVEGAAQGQSGLTALGGDSQGFRIGHLDGSPRLQGRADTGLPAPVAAAITWGLGSRR